MGSVMWVIGDEWDMMDFWGKASFEGCACRN